MSTTVLPPIPVCTHCHGKAVIGMPTVQFDGSSDMVAVPCPHCNCDGEVPCDEFDVAKPPHHVTVETNNGPLYWNDKRKAWMQRWPGRGLGMDQEIAGVTTWHYIVESRHGL